MNDKLKQIIREHIGCDEEKITDDASLIDDLGCDSLDVVELVMAVEEETGREITDVEAEKITLVRDFLPYFEPAAA